MKRYVQINAFYNMSTGSIMRQIDKDAQANGFETYMFWGRGKKSLDSHKQKFSSDISVLLHVIGARIFDRAGFFSKRDTLKLLTILDEINPDIVHLHGLQGYYINVPLIFDWLSNKKCKTYITLHDCWLFTGHCPYFSMIKCDKWKTHCMNCPQKSYYPKSVLFDSSYKNFEEKKESVLQLDKNNTTIICPSNWMAELARNSFLSKFNIIVKHNKINLSIFRPMRSDFKLIYNLENKIMILGVASEWTKRKGLNDFFKLNDMINSNYQIVLVGLTEKQIKKCPKNIIALQRTENQIELAKIYNAADVFVNPTYEDNYPTVNLEAEACGTPVYTYNTGGSPETIQLEESKVFNQGDIFNLAKALMDSFIYHV